MPALSAQLCQDLTNRHLTAGRTDRATLWAHMAVHAAPSSADAWAALGAAYKQQHRWLAAQQASQQAVRLDPTHQQAWTTIGFAATARWDGELAMSAWQALGVDQLHHDAIHTPFEQQEHVQVHFQTEFGPELVNAQRLGAATAVLIGIPTPASGRRCGEVVLLNDLFGQTYMHYNTLIRAFQMQAVLHPSRRSTWHAVVKLDWEDHMTDLGEHTSWSRALAHRWFNATVPRVENPWNTDFSGNPPRHVNLAVSAERIDDALAFLSKWLAARPNRVLHSLQQGLPMDR